VCEFGHTFLEILDIQNIDIDIDIDIGCEWFSLGAIDNRTSAND